MSRRVCVKKVDGPRPTIALHDAETGECFEDQYSVEIRNDENQIPTVVVTFKFTKDFLRSEGEIATPEKALGLLKRCAKLTPSR